MSDLFSSIGGEKDYSFIQTFIDYLKTIIDLIMGLFDAINSSSKTTEATTVVE